MFILRRVNKLGEHFHLSLGKHYSTHVPGSATFQHYISCEPSYPDKVGLIIKYDNGDDEGCWPLYYDFHYYIMTPRGETFEHIRLSNPQVNSEPIARTDGGYPVFSFYEYQEGDKRENKEACYVGEVEDEHTMEWSKEGELLIENVPEKYKLSDLNIFKNIPFSFKK